MTTRIDSVEISGRHAYKASSPLEYPETIQAIYEFGDPGDEEVLAFFRTRGRSHEDWLTHWTTGQNEPR